MAKNVFRTGKQTRPKTAVKGKRFRCAKCRKRSPKPVKTPAPWYCPRCQVAAPASEEGPGDSRDIRSALRLRANAPEESAAAQIDSAGGDGGG